MSALSELKKIWNDEAPKLRAITAVGLTWLRVRIECWALGLFILLVDEAFGNLMFTRSGLPLNPASGEKGHKPWLKALQKMVAKAIVRRQSLESGMIQGNQPVTQRQHRLREA